MVKPTSSGGNAATTRRRVPLALWLCASLSGGCFPLVTMGGRLMDGRGWEDPDPVGGGVTLPIPIKTISETSRNEQATYYQDARGERALLYGHGETNAYPETNAYRRDVWFIEVSYWQDRYGVLREYSVGIGKGGYYEEFDEDNDWGEKHWWWGAAAGLSFLEVSEGGDRSQAAGVYGSLGFYNVCYGGLVLRLTLAPDVELGGMDRNPSGITISYWWGVGTSAAAWYAGGYAAFGLMSACQAHKLLDADPVVRTMAEEILLMMGEREFDYMDWAAREAEPALAERIRGVMDAIRAGATARPARWPSAEQCIDRLDHPDRVVAIMAAQMLRALQLRDGTVLDVALEARVEQLLAEGKARSLAGPWRNQRDGG